MCVNWQRPFHCIVGLIVAFVLIATVGLGADEPAHPADGEHAASGDDAESSDGADGGAHGGIDYDQPPLTFEPPLAVWSLVLFLIFLFVAKKWAWLPLIEGLDAREARVMEGHAFAASARTEIQDLIRQHEARIAETIEEVQGIVATARQEAEQAKSEIIAQAGAEARELQESAIAEIHAATEEALSQLSGQVDEYTGLAVNQIMGRALRN